MNRITNLPACLLILLIPVLTACSQVSKSPYQIQHGAIVRGDTTIPELALVFTGDEFGDGGAHIASVLATQDVKASFFLTGKFYKNPEFNSLIQILVDDGHYLGAHSDQHLLYCDWQNRDSLLVTKQQFSNDLRENYKAMEAFGIASEDAPFFLPPYEWYNDSIAQWTKAMDFTLVNISYGTLSHADYTLPGTENYRDSDEIYLSIFDYEMKQAKGLNGFILLVHIGTDSKRTDKFYLYLDGLIRELKERAYSFKRIDELLTQN